MTKPFCILHISDLHRSPQDQISNDELISALVSDRDSYLHETPAICAPDAIIVSGDIIQGVPLGTANYASRLSEQYAAAEAFLEEMVRRFLDGDRSRIIIVPGNHDIDWNTAFAAFEAVDEANIPPHLSAALTAENSEFRWDWKTRKLYRIADRPLYDRRLAAFWTFFENFYANVPGLLDVKPNADANLFSLCGNRIGVAAFNSCYGNDCFAYHGMIPREAVSRSHLRLNDSGHLFDLRLAVWHHSIEGAPYRTDYMDVDIVRGMIGRGFRLGLYGHQHKTQAVGEQVWLSNQEKMAITSAGSLCAGARELPTGTYRQYSILEIAEDFRSARLHVRHMSVANLFSPARLPDFGGSSWISLDWTPPRNIAGAVVNMDAVRAQRAIEEAEFAVKTGEPKKAIPILRQLSLSEGSYQRELILIAASDASEWSAIIEITDPPLTIDELVKRVNALGLLGQTGNAIGALDSYARTLELPASIEADLRGRMKAQERMRR